ncbi:MAG: hypothetical protein JO232_22215 [Verrucomicrobia bacterium]|nr:hypothetical protein [Verrucomicrobiota bacterium]
MPKFELPTRHIAAAGLPPSDIKTKASSRAYLRNRNYRLIFEADLKSVHDHMSLVLEQVYKALH